MLLIGWADETNVLISRETERGVCVEAMYRNVVPWINSVMINNLFRVSIFRQNGSLFVRWKDLRGGRGALGRVA